MRKYYVDNIRWMTVVLVVIYHVIYMYNGVAMAGVIGPFYEVQYQDAIQYLLYPWFMIILFVISGMSARFYLEQHTLKEFVADKTRKLLVPSTIGLLAFQWIQGYISMSISSAFDTMPAEMPRTILFLIMVWSGTGVLWYLQVLWIFSMVLVLVRKVEKGRLFAICEKVNPAILLLLGVVVWCAAQILNMPIIVVYRFGIYGCCFFLGYFVFAHDTVVERLSRYWMFFSAAAVVFGLGYVYYYFGENYAEAPVVNSPFSIAYGWIMVLAIFAVMKKWGDIVTPFTKWMSKKSFGLYVFHYLPMSATAYLLHQYVEVPVIVAYLLPAIASFVGGYLLYEVVSRIPILRWCVLGIK